MASSSKEHAFLSKDIGQKQIRTYTERRSIRVIVLNDKNKILTMKSSGSSGLYRLPGGGIEGKEYLFEAGAMAVLEESGYEVELGPCMAVTEEWRGDLHLTCFCGRADIYACANHCSISRMCYFAVFNNTDKNCMWSNKPVSFTFTQDVEIDVAAVDPTTQLTVQYDTACPYANLTTVTTYNGMEAEVYCGLDNLAPNYCPTGNSSWVCPSHATSFQQCLDICSESHPLCWGIAYDPTLITGYANCYLKNSLPTPDELPLTGALNTAQYNGAILHAAVVTEKNGSSIPINCTNYAEINAQDGQTFVTSCNLTQLGHDLWQMHEGSLQSCIDECVTYNGEKCVAVVYDPQLNNGWENCYLKNSTTVNTQSVGMTLALVSTSSGSIPSSSGSPGGSHGSSKGGPKAWIAGPVIGGIFVLVAAAYGIFWWRKRSTSSRNRTSEQHPQRRAKVEGRTPGWEMDERRQRMYLSEMPSTGTIEGLVAQASV